MTAPDARAPLEILLVEDDDLSARTLRALLAPDGHQIEVVGDGRRALERLDERDYDVLITDIYMPSMDGIELLRTLRRRPRLPAIVAISGGGRTVRVDYLDLAERLGAQVVLRKPFTRRVLCDAIESALDACQSEAAAIEPPPG